MHFITGGAYNGKAKWVKAFYKNADDVYWMSAFENQSLPLDFLAFNNDMVVIEGIERWIQMEASQMEASEIRVKWRNIIRDWKSWEQTETNRSLILIGTDLTKGIVPLEKVNRIWRDAAGWIYQDITAEAERVDLIWYGLNKQLK